MCELKPVLNIRASFQHFEKIAGFKLMTSWLYDTNATLDYAIIIIIILHLINPGTKSLCTKVNIYVR